MLSYTPLNKEQSEVRLVRFCSGSEATTSDDAPIRLELRHASLNDEETQYAALSYVWGDQKDYREITVNNSPVDVGFNLYGALCRLRQVGVSSWLWLDSICIQQSNVEEKSWQVSLMRPVFSQAKVVYMWLGPGTKETDEAMDFLCRVGPRARASGASDLFWGVPQYMNLMRTLRRRYGRKQADDFSDQEILEADSELTQFISDFYGEKGLYSESLSSSESDKNILLQGLIQIMLRDYWHRVWIIQEVAMAQKGLLLCGEKSLLIDQLDAVLGAIEFCQRCKIATPRGGGTFANALSGNFATSIPLLARRHFHHHPDTISLRSLLVHMGTLERPHYSASDPRDIVFGVLGVVSEGEKLGLQVDYKMTIEEVFCQLTRALYHRGHRKRV